MQITEKIDLTRRLVEDNSADVSAYLSLAEHAILGRLYPFGHEGLTLPGKYDYLQCRLAARYFFRKGGEGEISHSENGIARTYGSVNDEDLLSEIVPMAKLI